MNEQKIINAIVDIVVSFLHPGKIILFGSRASGSGEEKRIFHGTDKVRKYSDFDIAVENAEINIRKERLLKDALDAKLGIYMVDLVDLAKVDPDFKNIIVSTGKVIYEA